MVPDYVDRWTVSIEDVTPRVERLRDLPARERTDPRVERPYPLPPEVAAAVGAAGGPT